MTTLLLNSLIGRTQITSFFPNQIIRLANKFQNNLWQSLVTLWWRHLLLKKDLDLDHLKSVILNQLNVFHFQYIEVIELFTDTAAILNLLDLRSIRGHSVSIYARFSGKKRTSMYTSWEKGDHYYIRTRHNDLFSHYNLFLGKLEKLARKARVNTAPWASHNTPYYSFKIFPKFWLAKSTRIIHHNQLLMTKFGRILSLTRKWRQKSGAIGSCKNAACYRLRHR